MYIHTSALENFVPSVGVFSLYFRGWWLGGRGGVWVGWGMRRGEVGDESLPLRPAHELSRAWEIPERTFYARKVVKLLIGANIALIQCIACSLVIF